MNGIESVGFAPGTTAAPLHGQAKRASGFKEVLKAALREVNRSQHEAGQLTQKLVTGEVEDLHTVLIAAEKANVQLQLAIQVRNKVVEAYQEVMRMQM
ncbi:Flagellar hook-basal body complex protein fliE [Caldalkalibacillus thermarum TA2.A1]|uniref:Flagellar hook-basal body complex protein FliE n=1 Tax=Caldalkalibacillus thermarum (strain TA2.A1) TaxID=986075 RepID=F5L818_CALTT|nr:flagellar hook-basal body complex protein FliE [Caldalkalibacillus thermarum]EGL82526.1 Flagellar hook-basal body complex protein fliE [Caldalkalibacillus thermarum TA2.A1]QZT33023.1 flagellar hook-basal body complex protein FliE [Caldalkalibacillus thermarum TA2.A1]GGK13781.1 hypothetical protein GCM10010965_03460 [Caldalkalibacillus thermarum]